MNLNSKILISGSSGLVGSSIVRKLKEQGYINIIPLTRKDCDLRNKIEVDNIFKKYKPEYVFNVAAKVGGINANNLYPAEFIYNNLSIQINVIDACYKFKVKKMLFVASSCIYPKNCPQPIKEGYLMTGPLETTNDAYATAKIAGIKMCDAYRKQYGCNFISVMPTNLYGPGDNFNLKSSHVFPALIRKFHDAKVNNETTVEIWGTGTPKREFLHVDDCADGLLFLMHNYNETGHINIGTGTDISIEKLSHLIREITESKCSIVWNTKYPDGTMRKNLDVSKIKDLGWRHKISLEDGIKDTYDWFLNNYKNIKK